MSPAEISDLQLDRLLGQMPPPSDPTPDLADHIVARALRTPQTRSRLLRIPRRHGPRRRPAVWTVVIAANLIAATAVAASWDGQQFDFHRLAALPHRVAEAAVRMGHPRQANHVDRSREHPRPAHEIASLKRHVIAPVPPTFGHSLSMPVMPAKARTAASHAVLHVHGVARARLHQQAVTLKPRQPIRPVLSKAAKLHRRPITSPEQVEPVGPSIGSMHVREADRSTAEIRRSERSERSATFTERPKPTAETSAPAKPPENALQTFQRPEGANGQRPNPWRGRERRWRSQVFKRMHPRARGNRFRGRF